MKTSTCVYTFRNNYATTPVTTAAYVEMIANLSVNCREIEVFDSSGQTINLAYGPAGSEVVACQIIPGGNGRIPVMLNKGMRIALKAISANCTVGECTINFYY